ncbi:MAG: hypothetical protein V1870_01930 [Candidatus Aenigmatarchaeota archaeon]
MLSRELVNGLDLIVASTIHPLRMQYIKRIRMNDQRGNVIQELADFSDLQYFAIDIGGLFYEHSIFHGLAPYLSRGEPKIEKRNYKEFIFGNRVSGRTEDVVNCYYGSVFENLLEKDGSVYYGLNESGKVVFFSKPMTFDSEKEFMLVRSPNNSVNPDNPLCECDLPEPMTLGSWIVLDGNVYEYDVGSINSDQQTMHHRFYFNQFDRQIYILDKNGRIELFVYTAGDKSNPAYRYVNGAYESIKEGDEPKLRGFKIRDMKQLEGFEPMWFDPNNNDFDEIRGDRTAGNFPEEKKSYSLVYESPRTLLEGKRWAFSDMNYQRGIVLYQNHHLSL